VGDVVRIYDTTLRDGCQGSGISLSLRDKLDIARRLDDLQVDWVECGWPGSNPKDEQLFRALREEPLRYARAGAFGSTRRAGIGASEDANLRALVEAGTPTVAIVAKAWDFHVDAVLRTTLGENLAMVRDSVAFLKAHGLEVVFDAEHFFDGYAANADYARRVLDSAREAGADWLVLCDTNGGSLPGHVAATTAAIVGDAGDRVGVHAHNDGEVAVANTLAAVDAGARHVQGTINGYGERTGNANLSSIVPNLVLKTGFECRARVDGLTALSRFVDDVANVAPNPRAAYVGARAFAHKGGLHAHAISVDPRTYEHVDPAVVGNARRTIVSELAGRTSVTLRARELGIELDDDRVAAGVATKLKEMESRGFSYEDADASFELLVRRADRHYHRPLNPVGYAVESRKDADDLASTSSASVEVLVDDEVFRAAAVGAGPVEAMERALRRALAPVHPELDDMILTNFRAEIVGGRAKARAPIRVQITGSWGDGRSWTTVGSSTNILHAAWIALGDSLEYALATREVAA
jgi:2-isopropylmalate synthase